jgi:ribonuclease VapC
MAQTACDLVLDTSAIIAIFKEEPGFEILEDKIDQATVILVGAPTLVETIIVLRRQLGKDPRGWVNNYLERIGAIVVEFGESHYALAAEAYLRFGKGLNTKAQLNFGDCLSYAAAQAAKQPLLFVGNDFLHTDIPAA